MRLILGTALVAALLSTGLAPTSVLAAGPSKEVRAAARTAYGLGQKLFAEDRFEESKAAFEEAFAAVPNPIVLKSIAECEVRLKQIGAAIETFERFLREQPETKDRGEIEERLVELRNMPAVLVLHSDPPGAAIQLDGKPGAGATPIEITVPPGEHVVELTADGYDAASKSILAGPGERTEVRLTLNALPELEPVAAAEPMTVSAADFESDDGQGSNVALWVTGTIGVLGIAAGTTLGLMTLSKQSEFDDNPTAKGADDGEQLALFADVGFGVGAIALATFAVLYLTDGEAESDDSALRVTPLVSRDGAGVSSSFAF